MDNYIVPKTLFTEKYKELSLGSKVLYMLCYAKVIENPSKEFYFHFPIKEIQELLQVSKPIVIKYKKELVNHGLLKEVKQGLGLPNKLYLSIDI